MVMAGAMQAQGRDESWADCKAHVPEKVISGCTVIINTNNESSDDVAAAFNNRGVAYARVGKYDNAISDFDQAIELKSNYIDMVEESALSLIQSAPNDAGILSLEGASENTPSAALFYKNRGVAKYRKGRYDSALEDFTQAVKLRRNYFEAMIDRGIVYADLGKYEKAVEDYDAVIEARPNDPSVFVDRGALYVREEKFEQALADFDHAIKVQPGYAGAYSSRCFANAIIGHLQLAMDDCNVALDIDPVLQTALDARGFTYLKLGKYDLAQADYGVALKQAVQDPNALYGRGMAEALLGDGAGAETDIAAAKKIDASIEDEFARWGISAMQTKMQQGNQEGSPTSQK